MSKRVLITGGSGLVGQQLTALLQRSDFEVFHLSRKERPNARIKTFKWDVTGGYLAEDALDGIDIIVHLAGAGVDDKRWSATYKKEILQSRTLSTTLLFDVLKSRNHNVKLFISASAIGIYPNTDHQVEFEESGPYGNDFLADVTKSWEAEVNKVSSLGIRIVVLRIGVVFSSEGGALDKMVQPVRYGFGAALGSGNQYLSWIHIEDLTRMFEFVIRNEKVAGTFNAVGPSPSTNREVTKCIAKTLNKVYFLPNIPGFLLKLILGEIATIILGGTKVSSQKIENCGFEFKFRELKNTLADLLVK